MSSCKPPNCTDKNFDTCFNSRNFCDITGRPDTVSDSNSACTHIDDSQVSRKRTTAECSATTQLECEDTIGCSWRYPIGAEVENTTYLVMGCYVNNKNVDCYGGDGNDETRDQLSNFSDDKEKQRISMKEKDTYGCPGNICRYTPSNKPRENGGCVGDSGCADKSKVECLSETNCKWEPNDEEFCGYKRIIQNTIGSDNDDITEYVVSGYDETKDLCRKVKSPSKIECENWGCIWDINGIRDDSIEYDIESTGVCVLPTDDSCMKYYCSTNTSGVDSNDNVPDGICNYGGTVCTDPGEDAYRIIPHKTPGLMDIPGLNMNTKQRNEIRKIKNEIQNLKNNVASENRMRDDDTIIDDIKNKYKESCERKISSRGTGQSYQLYNYDTSTKQCYDNFREHGALKDNLPELCITDPNKIPEHNGFSSNKYSEKDNVHYTAVTVAGRCLFNGTKEQEDTLLCDSSGGKCYDICGIKSDKSECEGVTCEDSTCTDNPCIWHNPMNRCRIKEPKEIIGTQEEKDLQVPEPICVNPGNHTKQCSDVESEIECNLRSDCKSEFGYINGVCETVEETCRDLVGAQAADCSGTSGCVYQAQVDPVEESCTATDVTVTAAVEACADIQGRWGDATPAERQESCTSGGCVYQAEVVAVAESCSFDPATCIPDPPDGGCGGDQPAPLKKCSEIEPNAHPDTYCYNDCPFLQFLQPQKCSGLCKYISDADTCEKPTNGQDGYCRDPTIVEGCIDICEVGDTCNPPCIYKDIPCSENEESLGKCVPRDPDADQSVVDCNDKKKMDCSLDNLCKWDTTQGDCSPQDVRDETCNVYGEPSQRPRPTSTECINLKDVCESEYNKNGECPAKCKEVHHIQRDSLCNDEVNCGNLFEYGVVDSTMHYLKVPDKYLQLINKDLKHEASTKCSIDYLDGAGNAPKHEVIYNCGGGVYSSTDDTGTCEKWCSDGEKIGTDLEAEAECTRRTVSDSPHRLCTKNNGVCSSGCIHLDENADQGVNEKCYTTRECQGSWGIDSVDNTATFTCNGVLLFNEGSVVYDTDYSRGTCIEAEDLADARKNIGYFYYTGVVSEAGMEVRKLVAITIKGVSKEGNGNDILVIQPLPGERRDEIMNSPGLNYIPEDNIVVVNITVGDIDVNYDNTVGNIKGIKKGSRVLIVSGAAAKEQPVAGGVTVHGEEVDKVEGGFIHFNLPANVDTIVAGGQHTLFFIPSLDQEECYKDKCMDWTNTDTTAESGPEIILGECKDNIQCLEGSCSGVGVYSYDCPENCYYDGEYSQCTCSDPCMGLGLAGCEEQSKCIYTEDECKLRPCYELKDKDCINTNGMCTYHEGGDKKKLITYYADIKGIHTTTGEVSNVADGINDIPILKGGAGREDTEDTSIDVDVKCIPEGPVPRNCEKYTDNASCPANCYFMYNNNTSTPDQCQKCKPPPSGVCKRPEIKSIKKELECKGKYITFYESLESFVDILLEKERVGSDGATIPGFFEDTSDTPNKFYPTDKVSSTIFYNELKNKFINEDRDGWRLEFNDNYCEDYLGIGSRWKKEDSIEGRISVNCDDWCSSDSFDALFCVKKDEPYCSQETCLTSDMKCSVSQDKSSDECGRCIFGEAANKDSCIQLTTCTTSDCEAGYTRLFNEGENSTHNELKGISPGKWDREKNECTTQSEDWCPGEQGQCEYTWVLGTGVGGGGWCLTDTGRLYERIGDNCDGNDATPEAACIISGFPSTYLPEIPDEPSCTSLEPIRNKSIINGELYDNDKLFKLFNDPVLCTNRTTGIQLKGIWYSDLDDSSCTLTEPTCQNSPTAVPEVCEAIFDADECRATGCDFINEDNDDVFVGPKHVDRCIRSTQTSGSGEYTLLSGTCSISIRSVDPGVDGCFGTADAADDEPCSRYQGEEDCVSKGCAFWKPDASLQSARETHRSMYGDVWSPDYYGCGPQEVPTGEIPPNPGGIGCDPDVSHPIIPSPTVQGWDPGRLVHNSHVGERAAETTAIKNPVDTEVWGYYPHYYDNTSDSHNYYYLPHESKAFKDKCENADEGCTLHRGYETGGCKKRRCNYYDDDTCITADGGGNGCIWSGSIKHDGDEICHNKSGSECESSRECKWNSDGTESSCTPMCDIDGDDECEGNGCVKNTHTFCHGMYCTIESNGEHLLCDDTTGKNCKYKAYEPNIIKDIAMLGKLRKYKYYTHDDFKSRLIQYIFNNSKLRKKIENGKSEYCKYDDGNDGSEKFYYHSSNKEDDLYKEYYDELYRTLPLLDVDENPGQGYRELYNEQITLEHTVDKVVYGPGDATIVIKLPAGEETQFENVSKGTDIEIISTTTPEDKKVLKSGSGEKYMMKSKKIYFNELAEIVIGNVDPGNIDRVYFEEGEMTIKIIIGGQLPKTYIVKEIIFHDITMDIYFNSNTGPLYNVHDIINIKGASNINFKDNFNNSFIMGENTAIKDTYSRIIDTKPDLNKITINNIKRSVSGPYLINSYTSQPKECWNITSGKRPNKTNDPRDILCKYNTILPKECSIDAGEECPLYCHSDNDGKCVYHPEEIDKIGNILTTLDPVDPDGDEKFCRKGYCDNFEYASNLKYNQSPFLRDTTDPNQTDSYMFETQENSSDDILINTIRNNPNIKLEKWIIEYIVVGEGNKIFGEIEYTTNTSFKIHKFKDKVGDTKTYEENDTDKIFILALYPSVKGYVINWNKRFKFTKYLPKEEMIKEYPKEDFTDETGGGQQRYKAIDYHNKIDNYKDCDYNNGIWEGIECRSHNKHSTIRNIDVCENTGDEWNSSSNYCRMSITTPEKYCDDKNVLNNSISFPINDNAACSTCDFVRHPESTTTTYKCNTKTNNDCLKKTESDCNNDDMCEYYRDSMDGPANGSPQSTFTCTHKFTETESSVCNQAINQDDCTTKKCEWQCPFTPDSRSDGYIVRVSATNEDVIETTTESDDRYYSPSDLSISCREGWKTNATEVTCIENTDSSTGTSSHEYRINLSGCTPSIKCSGNQINQNLVNTTYLSGITNMNNVPEEFKKDGELDLTKLPDSNGNFVCPAPKSIKDNSDTLEGWDENTCCWSVGLCEGNTMGGDIVCPDGQVTKKVYYGTSNTLMPARGTSISECCVVPGAPTVTIPLDADYQELAGAVGTAQRDAFEENFRSDIVQIINSSGHVDYTLSSDMVEILDIGEGSIIVTFRINKSTDGKVVLEDQISRAVTPGTTFTSVGAISSAAPNYKPYDPKAKYIYWSDSLNAGITLDQLITTIFMIICISSCAFAILALLMK